MAKAVKEQPFNPEFDVDFSLIPKKIGNILWEVDSGKYKRPDDAPDIDDIMNIINTDGRARQCLEFPVDMALNNMRGYRHPEPAVEEWVLENVFGRFNVKKALASIVGTARWVGVSVSYVNLQTDEGDLIIKDIFTINPRAYIDDGIGEKKITFETADGKTLSIDRSHFIVYSHGSDFHEVYGKSLLQYTFKHYKMKEEVLMAWRAFLRRFAIPMTILWVEPGISKKDMDQCADGLENLSYNSIAVIPRNVDKKKPTRELQFLEADKGAADFNVLYETLDKEISHALGIPDSIYGASPGTYGAAMAHQKTLIRTVQKCQDMIEDVIHNYLLAPILKFQFGTNIRGRLYFKSLEGKEFLDEVKAWVEMNNAAMVDDEAIANAFSQMGISHGEGGSGSGAGKKKPASGKTSQKKEGAVDGE